MRQVFTILVILFPRIFVTYDGKISSNFKTDGSEIGEFELDKFEIIVSNNEVDTGDFDSIDIRVDNRFVDNWFVDNWSVSKFWFVPKCSESVSTIVVDIVVKIVTSDVVDFGLFVIRFSDRFSDNFGNSNCDKRIICIRFIIVCNKLSFEASDANLICNNNSCKISWDLSNVNFIDFNICSFCLSEVMMLLKLSKYFCLPSMPFNHTLSLIKSVATPFIILISDIKLFLNILVFLINRLFKLNFASLFIIKFSE